MGNFAVAAKGALGISSRMRADDARERRTANSAPEALMFRAVANSRNSLPFSSRLRTKTGMASGSRGHCRRSVIEVVLRANGETLKSLNVTDWHIWGQTFRHSMSNPLPGRVVIPRWGRLDQNPRVTPSLPSFYLRNYVGNVVTRCVQKHTQSESVFPLVGNLLHFALTRQNQCHTIRLTQHAAKC